MEKAYRVYTSKNYERKLKKIPKDIRRKTDVWIRTVIFKGVDEIRKRPGYHDEPLQGERFGQRSVRLNKSYRLIYTEYKLEKIILLLEVTKHEY
ncbi:MAG: type II toxin-antitoxin system mRNA interferase toxin, RelE/StbE family [Pseudomonadota bacterium]